MPAPFLSNKGTSTRILYCESGSPDSFFTVPLNKPRTPGRRPAAGAAIIFDSSVNHTGESPRETSVIQFPLDKLCTTPETKYSPLKRSPSPPRVIYFAGSTREVPWNFALPVILENSLFTIWALDQLLRSALSRGAGVCRLYSARPITLDCRGRQHWV
jgi:hypothetical protein